MSSLDIIRTIASVEQIALRRCLGLQAGEQLVVVTDPPRLDAALALQAAGLEAEAEAVVVVQDAARKTTELPGATAAGLAQADVFVGITSGSISHSPARAEATARGARGASMGGSTPEMLERMFGADLDAVGRRSRLAAAALEAACEARITCPRGTDLRLALDGSTGLADDGDLRAPGSFGNLPFGEGFTVPSGGDGLVFPSTIAGLGRVGADTRLTIADGRLLAADGADGARLLASLDRHGPLGRNVAELGVGAHDAAELSGYALEEEKLLGSIHVAFGASAALGGRVSVPVHVDCVVPDARLELDGVELRIA